VQYCATWPPGTNTTNHTKALQAYFPEGLPGAGRKALHRFPAGDPIARGMKKPLPHFQRGVRTGV